MVTPQDYYEEVGRLIYKARDGRLTQEQLADRVDLSRTSITNIEKGRQRIMLHTLVQIAEVLGVSVAKLLPETEGESNKKLNQALKEHSKVARDWVRLSLPSPKKGTSK